MKLSFKKRKIYTSGNSKVIVIPIAIILYLEQKYKNNINNMIFDLSINMNTADNDKLIFTLRN